MCQDLKQQSTAENIRQNEDQGQNFLQRATPVGDPGLVQVKKGDKKDESKPACAMSVV